MRNEVWMPMNVYTCQDVPAWALRQKMEFATFPHPVNILRQVGGKNVGKQSSYICLQVLSSNCGQRSRLYYQISKKRLNISYKIQYCSLLEAQIIQNNIYARNKLL